MRLIVAAVIFTLVACSAGGNPPQASSSNAPPAAATQDQLLQYYGSYLTDSGDVFIVARLGWFFDLRTSAYRTIYVVRAPNEFSIGCRFRVPVPSCADIAFGPDTISVSDSTHGTTLGYRVHNTRTDVAIPAVGAHLAATITAPQGVEPRGGIVIIHGAEPGQRYFYDIWVGLYTSLGLDVLTYDKRGQGDSTGTYPGEFPTEQALEIYADDAAAALKFLAGWPHVDPKRVGFHGGSQGGWTVPLSISRHDLAAFAVLVSAPATTVDQTDTWAGFSGGGGVMPSESEDQMLAAARAVHSGYDPAPALRSLSVPTLWLLGANDRTVPTRVCMEILTAMAKPNFKVQLLPTGHGLLVNPTGLLRDDDTSPGLAPELVPTIQSWLTQSIGSSSA